MKPQKTKKQMEQEALANATEVLKNLCFRKEWVTMQADYELVCFAEKAGKEMAEKQLKSSKFRSIYGEMKRIQMTNNIEKNKASFLLLKPKVSYAYARDKLNEGLILFKLIFDKAFENVTDQNSFNNFCNLFEAIIAYHKTYVENDK